MSLNKLQVLVSFLLQKTTLAKHLQRILGSCLLLHQDDYAPVSHPLKHDNLTCVRMQQQADKIPIHPTLQIQDWDDPEGAIDWPLMRNSLSHLKYNGIFPENHISGDHLQFQRTVPIPVELFSYFVSPYTSYMLIN